MYKLCVFAGTTEGRKLIELLAGQPVTVTACVATEYGESLLEPRENLTVSHKRLDREEMEKLFTQEGFDLWYKAISTHWFTVHSTSFHYREYYASLMKTRGFLCHKAYAETFTVEEDQKKQIITSF